MPPSPNTPDKALLTAWLLLGLRHQGERHGWGLVSELRRAGVHVEPGRAYRILRSLESAGAVTSRWTAPVNGPRRRAYRMTPEGRCQLDELVSDVKAAWQLNDAFVRAYEGAHGEDQPGGPALQASDAPAAQGTPGDDAHLRAHPTRELLAAWLLLLIEHHASYGYDLRRALSDHDVQANPATMYRVLRRLDDTGWLDARWIAPDRGPRRRLYRLTARGRRNLDDVARIISAARDTHGAFLHACETRAAAASTPTSLRKAAS